MSSSPSPPAKSSSKDRKSRSSSRNNPRRLNEINFLNAGYCIASTLLNVGVGLVAWFTPTYAQQSVHFTTLISPAPWTVTLIWILIYVSQISFAVFQLTPVLRARAQIQDGVKYFYGLASLFQVLYTISYCQEMLWASLFCSFGVIFSLRSLVDSEAQAASDHSWAEFWILRFPFQLHLGWIDFVSVLTFNNILVKMNVQPLVQIIFACVSAAILMVVTYIEIFWVNKPLFVIPLVFLYAIVGTVYELFLPSSDYHHAYFKKSTIYHITLITVAFWALLAVIVFIRWFMYFRRGEYKAEKKEGEEDKVEETDYVNADKLQNEVV